MHWILVAYVIALTALTFKADQIVTRAALGSAWRWLGAIGFCHLMFAMFRAGNAMNPKDLMLAGFWEEGVSWTLLGVSMFCLAGGIAPKGKP